MIMNTLDRTGFFISLDGPDGCGKSTQVLAVEKHLKKAGFACLVTEEPGGTKLGKVLTRVLLDPKNKGMDPRAELFLYLADRAQHVHEVIIPALKEGKVVVTSRYADATVAYQAFGRKLSLEAVMEANELAVDGLQPDLTILLDIPPEEGLKRLKRKTDRMESEKLEFHRRVRHGYLMLAKAAADRCRVVDARKAKGKVTKEVVNILSGAGLTG